MTGLLLISLKCFCCLNESTMVKYIIYTMPIQLLTIDSSLNLTFRLHQPHYKVISLLTINRVSVHEVYLNAGLLERSIRPFCSVWSSVMERENRADTLPSIRAVNSSSLSFCRCLIAFSRMCVQLE